MKGFVVIVMAVIMLGLALPAPSQADDAWVPAAIIGGIIVGAAVAHAEQPVSVHARYAPEPVYIYHPPRPVYVQPRHVRHYYNRPGIERWDNRHGHHYSGWHRH
jgi:hypothetical protein